MSKFSCDLAEDLYERTLDFGQDEELGNSEAFGWFALFREERLILSVNAQGFVEVILPRDVEATWKSLRDENDWHELDSLDSSCDGLFLILDTARHGGWIPDFEDVVRHIENCETCDSLGNFLEL